MRNFCRMRLAVQRLVALKWLSTVFHLRSALGLNSDECSLSQRKFMEWGDGIKLSVQSVSTVVCPLRWKRYRFMAENEDKWTNWRIAFLSASCSDFSSFGGWRSPHMKQYNDKSGESCCILLVGAPLLNFLFWNSRCRLLQQRWCGLLLLSIVHSLTSFQRPNNKFWTFLSACFPLCWTDRSTESETSLLVD